MSKYKRFGVGKTKDADLPQPAIDMVDSVRGWQNYAGWTEAYFKNDGSKPSDWIVVTDNGGYYKVGAEFMTWTYDDNYDGAKYEDEKTRAWRYNDLEIGRHVSGQANWSLAALHRTIMALKKGEETPIDPNYQT